MFSISNHLTLQDKKNKKVENPRIKDKTTSSYITQAGDPYDRSRNPYAKSNAQRGAASQGKLKDTQNDSGYITIQQQFGLTSNLSDAPILRLELYENGRKKEHNPNSKYI